VTKTLEVLENDLQRLTEVEGIAEKSGDDQ